MKQWYTLHTKAKAEYQVSEVLSANGIETFLPKFVKNTWGSKPKVEPLFPCYLFFCADLKKLDPKLWRWTPGVRCIVAFDEQPAAVPTEVIHLLQERFSERAQLEPSSHLKPGDRVKIKGGPFDEMMAVFDGPTTPNTSKRVQILLTILGSTRRVKLDASCLEPLKKEGAGALSRKRRTRGRARRIKH